MRRKIERMERRRSQPQSWKVIMVGMSEPGKTMLSTFVKRDTRDGQLW
jgi:hypothetical protein